MENNGHLHGIHPTGKLLFTILVAFLTTFLILLVGMFVAAPFLGLEITKIMSGNFDFADPENMYLAKYLQLLSHLGMFIVPSFILAWWFGRRIFSYLYLNNNPGIRILFLSGVIIFAAVPFINYVLELNMQMHFPESLKGLENWMRQSEETAERVTRSFLAVESTEGLLFNIFLIAVIPAIGEELMFRGVLMRIFRQWLSNPHWAVWITAIIFSTIHMQFFGFFPRMILGVLFGYLVVYSGSLWPAIVAHFVNNAAAVISFYLHHQQVTDDTLENIGKGPQGVFYALASLSLVILILWWIMKKSAGHKRGTITD
jgi:uncharacterized protein